MTDPDDEIRAFPEEARSGRTVEAAVGVEGADRVYQTKDSYDHTVTFFDRTLARDGFQITHHTTTQTATIWSLHAPDGSPARVAVRNTNPTTIEVLAAAGASAVETLPPGKTKP
ncbi:MAG: hypothetical protein ACREC5_04485 [Thermoplasmata archaeon]